MGFGGGCLGAARCGHQGITCGIDSGRLTDAAVYSDAVCSDVVRSVLPTALRVPCLGVPLFLVRRECRIYCAASPATSRSAAATPRVRPRAPPRVPPSWRGCAPRLPRG